MIIIMRATLHDRAPNTYYGQWPAEKPLFPGLASPAIAHNELAASARFGTFDGPARDFPGNRSPARWKFLRRPQKKILRAGATAALGASAGLFMLVGTADLQVRIMIERIYMRA